MVTGTFAISGLSRREAHDRIIGNRDDLPVIANAARDVTNNIGNAGRTAQSQIQEMVSGFKRITEFGQASERQVEVLRKLADETMTGLNEQSAKLEELATRRAEQDKKGWKPAAPRTRKVTTALKAYALLATSADKGAVRNKAMLDGL